MANRKKSPSGELALIARLRTPAGTPSGSHVRLGIGDDCAILRAPAGHELLVTTDFSLEDRHFRRAWHSPRSIGHRTLARGLSDLAAMGARPLAAFLSLALPKAVVRDTRWLDGFLAGLLALARENKVPLAGGDTSEAPGTEVLADIVLVGSAPAGRALTRSGARPGDTIYCTGGLGGAAAELAQLSKAPARFRRATADEAHPHLFPQPRLAVGATLLRRRLATACIDVSDGLSTDLNHLCEASGVAAELDAALLPAHPLTAALPPARQLLFTARPTTKIPRSLSGVSITRIGRVVRRNKSRPRVTIVAEGTRFELQPHGWEHLR
jgi:thiamine-monophosphate kinase